jgi:hypothetical protein
MLRFLLVLVLGGLIILASFSLRAFRAWRRSRRLAAITRATSPSHLDRYLTARDETVLEAACTRLAELAPAEDLLPTLHTRAPETARALARALGRKSPKLLEQALVAETDPTRRLRLAHGLATNEAGIKVLVEALASLTNSPEDRGFALDALEASPREAVLPHVRAAFANPPTPELLWALSDAGEPQDALLAAPHVATDSFPVASSACETIAALLDRGEPPDPARVRELVTLGKSRIREFHPPRQNPLADELVARLEELEERLGTRSSVPA